MRELSLHILDLVQNSIAAKATEISILIVENISNNLLTIEIKDNGCGMTKEQLKKVTDPFYTTRKTRDVGFGIAICKETADRCDGKLEVDSKMDEGTTVRFELKHNHLNRPPIGNISETIQILVMANPEIIFHYHHKFNEKMFQFNSSKYQDELFSNNKLKFKVLNQIKKDLAFGLKQLQGNDSS